MGRGQHPCRDAAVAATAADNNDCNDDLGTSFEDPEVLAYQLK